MQITFEKDKNRVVATEDNKIIGECDFIIQDNVWNIVHTIVNSSYQGQGIAKKLVLSVIENAKKENIKVVADCSYAQKVLEKHHEI